MGQFVLTGSQQFGLMSTITESLAGSVGLVQLLPLALQELETKNYSDSLLINGHGEFTAMYGDARYGIESAIEQSRRHERILCKLLERLDIAGRSHKKPDFHHVVMVHPKAIIERPQANAFDTSNLIKADQFPTWHARFIDKQG